MKKFLTLFRKFSMAGVSLGLSFLLLFVLSVPCFADTISGNMETVFPWFQFYWGYYSPQDEKQGSGDFTYMIGQTNENGELSNLQGGFLALYLPVNLRNNLRTRFLWFDFAPPYQAQSAGSVVNVSFDWTKVSGFNYSSITILYFGNYMSTGEEFIISRRTFATSGDFSFSEDWSVPSDCYFRGVRVAFSVSGNGSSGVTRLLGTFYNASFTWPGSSSTPPDLGNLEDRLLDIDSSINRQTEEILSKIDSLLTSDTSPALDSSNPALSGDDSYEHYEDELLGIIDLPATQGHFQNGLASLISHSKAFLAVSGFFNGLFDSIPWLGYLFAFLVPLGLVSALLGIISLGVRKGS